MKTKINIRYFVGHYQPIYTGAGKSLEKLIHALDKSLFNIEIITAYKKGLKRREQKDGYTIIRKGIGFFNSQGRLNNLGKLNFSLSAAVYNLFYKKYDILVFIGVGQVSFFSILIAKLLKKSIVNKTTGVGDDDPRKLAQTFIGKKLIKLTSKNTAHWIISKEIYNYALEYTNWKKDSLHLITNPVKIDYKNYLQLSNERNKKQKEKIKNFLFVGILDKRKGVDILLDIWKKIDTKATLTLCGPFGKNLDLNEKIKTLKSKNIKILGELNKDEIKEQYLSADYFIFPSNREGLPNVMLESMSFGLPIIANKIEGVTDFLIGTNNERGILIENNDLNIWIKTITEILKKNDTLEVLAKNAYHWVFENSSYEVVGNKMEKMYQQLINNEI